MNKPLHVIYLPGLGDGSLKIQDRLVKTWQNYGVSSEQYNLYWSDKKPWQPKLEKLLAHIDEINLLGKSVGLVGASAGASAAINAFAARKDSIVGIVLISGKVNRPEAIGKSYSRTNPAFLTSVQQCVSSLAKLEDTDRRKILSRYALIDEIVLISDSRIPGARNKYVPTIGHAFTIITQLLLGAPSFVKFLKRLNKHT
ncbi:MAG: hypothetical protein NVS1B10_01760 [Candidatus Saccharimonadales bacterium]